MTFTFKLPAFVLVKPVFLFTLQYVFNKKIFCIIRHSLCIHKIINFLLLMIYKHWKRIRHFKYLKYYLKYLSKNFGLIRILFGRPLCNSWTLFIADENTEKNTGRIFEFERSIARPISPRTLLSNGAFELFTHP